MKAAFGNPWLRLAAFIAVAALSGWALLGL
jgi:hypothetical protein